LSDNRKGQITGGTIKLWVILLLSMKLLFGILVLMSAALFVLLLVATGTSPNIFSGEIAYTGQDNAVSSGEIAYVGQRNAISSGEIPSVGLFNSQIPKTASLKSTAWINLTKPNNTTMPLNMTNQSINMPSNMTNQSLNVTQPLNVTNSAASVGNAAKVVLP
jgi:hypothetical protein